MSYPSVLLNDLHRYFPDLLYRSERFQTVQDLLQYIIGVAQDNPYDRERRQYLREHPLESEERERERERENGESEESKNDHPDATHLVEHSHPDHVLEEKGDRHIMSSASSSSESQMGSLLDPDNLFRALLEPRPVVRPSSRFRLSVPMDLSFLSYYVPAHPLSQFSDVLQSDVLQSDAFQSDAFQSVVIRPTEQHLAENTYVYCSEVAHQENCAICQDPMEAGQETRTILACSHCFHRECIDPWFQEHVRCPTCRRDVREAC